MPVFNAILERFDSKQRSIIVAREMLFALAILLLLSSSQTEHIRDWSMALFISWTATATILTTSPFLMRYPGNRGRWSV